MRRRCLLLAGLGDPQLETSKLFIAEPSRGGSPERSWVAPAVASPATEFAGLCRVGLVFSPG